jgi:hypothetical protein
LQGALYDPETQFPRGFKPKQAGMQCCPDGGFSMIKRLLGRFSRRKPTPASGERFAH